jgi:hypothetical protein
MQKKKNFVKEPKQREKLKDDAEVKQEKRTRSRKR